MENLEEKNGPGFEADGVLRARARTWAAVNNIAARLNPGMLETDAARLADLTLRELGAEKNWHRSFVRFGVNTTRAFGQASAPGICLREDDLFFLDLGPVFDGYEGDCGNTFVVGENEEKRRCAVDCRELHRRVAERWRREDESGQALYAFAQREARERGWELNVRKAGGHRISDFPHALHFRGSLSERPYRPASQRWILEIQIRHPERPYGAFYEDLLFPGSAE